MNGIDILNRSCRAAHIWIGDVADELGAGDRDGYRALGAVLHALRDHLPAKESAHLAAPFPVVVRGIYFDGWNPAAQNGKNRNRKKFIGRVAAGLEESRLDPEDACHAVFNVLNHHIGSGAVKKARQSLSKSIRALWPDPDEEGDQTPPGEEDEAEEDRAVSGNGNRAYGPAGGGPAYTLPYNDPFYRRNRDRGG